MKRTVVDCDRCGKKGIDPVNLRLEVGREPDPSGNGGNSVVEIPEICISCASVVLNSIAKDFSHERAARMHEEIRAYRRTIRGPSR